MEKNTFETLTRQRFIVSNNKTVIHNIKILHIRQCQSLKLAVQKTLLRKWKDITKTRKNHIYDKGFLFRIQQKQVSKNVDNSIFEWTEGFNRHFKVNIWIINNHTKCSISLIISENASYSFHMKPVNIF